MLQPAGNFLKPLLAGAVIVLSILACDIDQHFPPLIIGGYPKVFESLVGEIHDWSASVIPGVKYEVELKLQSIRTDLSSKYAYDGKNELRVGGGEACPDCVLSTAGFVTLDGLKISFIGPQDGKVAIIFIPSDRLGNCTIRLYEYGKPAVIFPETLSDKFTNRANVLTVLSSIFLLITTAISVRKSQLVYAVVSVVKKTTETPIRLNIFPIWLGLAGAALAVLFWIWIL